MDLLNIHFTSVATCDLGLEHPDSDEREQGQGRHGRREKLSMKKCHTKCGIQRGQVYTT